MAQGRIDQQWNHTAEILTVLYNVHRDPEKKSQPWTAKDFHPAYRHKAKQGLPWRMAAEFFESEFGLTISKPQEEKGRQ